MKEKSRMNGGKIAAKLVVLLGSLAYVMVFAVINGSVGFLCSMGVTLFGAVGVAKALGEQIALSYGWIAGLAIGLGVVRGALRFVEQYCNHYIAFRLLAVLRDKIFTALRRLCPAKLESKKKGSIIAMLTSDIETLEVFYAHTVSPVCIAVAVSAAVAAFVGFAVSPWLALVAAVGFVAVGVISPLISSKLMRDAGVRYRTVFSAFNAYFLDSIKGIRDIVLNNAGEQRKREVSRRSDELLGHARDLKYKIAGATAVTEFTVSLMTLVATSAAVALALTGTISAGKAVIGVVAIFGSFGPVIAISALPGNLTQTFASGDRVLKLIAEKPVVSEIKDGERFSFEKLEVKDMSFGYESDAKVLEDICMHTKRGEIVGIVGESGCGKSTLLKLLLRFWSKDGGEIDYNGTDIEKINSQSLTDNVTMVSQSTYLFDESIEENLRVAKRDATKEELEAACRQASVHDFIAGLPEGYATRAGALGDNLSAGEKQRIGLARAFLRGSGLILLDEPTSNVDSINEGMILGSLVRHKKDRAIILVSHRESTMSVTDRVYRIEKGRIREVKGNERM